MPSFDIVSEVEMHEVRNAVDQANREVNQRFDFKDTGAKFDLEGSEITLVSQSDFQLQQMLDILRQKLARRKVDVGCLDPAEPEVTGREARQRMTVRQGVDTELAREIVKSIKGAKMKVQASIQGDRVRVSGKKRDDLQNAIGLVKDKGYELPLQYINFRD